jgi:hypothetical protein
MHSWPKEMPFMNYGNNQLDTNTPSNSLSAFGTLLSGSVVLKFAGPVFKS